MTQKTIRLLLFLLLSLISNQSYSQKEWNNWLFGKNAGLNFNTSPPTVINGGKINTREGCSSISDKSTGDLLFYSDGSKVWNRNHQIMPNGNNLNGDYSASQSSIIVPKPGAPNRYYLFTAPAIANPTGYYYSEVDMTLNNGLGDIIPSTKNTFLYGSATETLTAVRHCNGLHYWVITHKLGSSEFYIYKITENGVDAPIIQSVGSNLPNNGWNAVGTIAVSQNGKLLAHTIGPDASGNSGGIVEIFDFDSSTGQLSLKFQFPKFGSPSRCIFSPSSRYLYLTTGLSSAVIRGVYQLDLSLGNANIIQDNAYFLWSSSEYAYGDLQITNQGQIFVAKEKGYNNATGYLDAILSPDANKANCNYQEDFVNLAPNKALLGLPSYIANLNYSPPYGNFDTVLCSNQTITIHGQQYDASNPTGSFTVSNNNQCDSIVLVKVLFIPAIQENYSQTLCTGQTLDINGTIFSESNPSGSVTIPNAAQGGCDSIVNVQLLFLPAIQENYSQTLCTGQTLDINGTIFSESNPSGSVTIPNAAQGGCDSIVNVQLLFIPTIQENYSQTLCTGQTLDINGTTFSESNPSGSVTLLNAAQDGCDSIVNVQLTFTQTITSEYQVNSCIGDTVVINGQSFQFDHPSGSVLLPGGAMGGCDSLINVDLRFYDDTASIHQTLCIADSLIVGNNIFSFNHPSGIVSISGAAYTGCDSIIDVNLDFYAVDTTFFRDTICWYDTILVNNHIYSFEKKEGFEVIPTDECDSLVAIQLFSPYDQIPIIDILSKDSICYGETVKLSAFSTLDSPIYTWLQNDTLLCDSCENVLTPIIRDDDVMLIGIDPIGCQLVSKREFDVLMNYGVYIPNVFSPNGDGINDKFTVYANKKGRKLIKLHIYDRWGNRVYVAENKDVQAFKSDGWDGRYKEKKMNTGVYVYVALIEFIDGDVREFSGDVTLIR